MAIHLKMPAEEANLSGHERLDHRQHRAGLDLVVPQTSMPVY